MLNLIPAGLLSTGMVDFEVVQTTPNGRIGLLGYYDGLPMGTVDAVDASDVFQGGARYTEAGRMRLFDATAGLPVGSIRVGGVSVSSTGQVCVTTDAVAGSSVRIGGVAVDQSGRIHAQI